MREILFKGKRVDNGEWVEGYYVYDYRNNAHLIIKNEMGVINAGFKPSRKVYSLGDYEVIPETISQFTGLTDKNGVKIFENDIVEHIEEFDRETEFGEIRRWTENKRYIVIYDLEEADYKATNGEKEYKGNYTYLGQYKKEEDNVEIIGNIFDNPELLEASND